MRQFDQSSATCRLFTYKEGLFSSLAHDLRISVTSFTIALGGKDHFIDARFDARSLRVDCAMEGGKEKPGLLSSRDRREIDDNIIKEVLLSTKHPEATLLSSSVKREGQNYLVKAALTLSGRTRDISFEVLKEDGERYAAYVKVNLPDFGITPFTALFGAIRIKPGILVHISIPADGLADELLI